MKNRKIGILLSYVNTGLSMVCGLFLSAFLLRMLGDTEYGLYKTMVSFVGMLAMFEFGTGTVMTRNVTLCRGKGASKQEIDRNVSTVWTITNILVLVILIFSAVFFFSIDNIYIDSLTASQIQYSKEIFIFAVIYLLVVFYTQTFNGIVLAYEYYSFMSLVSIVRCIGRTVVLVGVILMFKYAIVIAIVDAAIDGIVAVCTLVFCHKKCNIHFTFRMFDASVFKQSLPLCFAIFLQGIVNQANNNVDNFLIGVKLNPESVALYSVALYIYSVFSSATTIPISLYAPQIVSDVAKGLRKRQLTDTLVQPCRLVVLVGGSMLFGFVAAGRPFLELVYGEEYISAWMIALIIMVPMFINMANGVVVNVLDAMNKRMVRSNILIVTTVLNLVLTVIWLDQWGIVGAACATAVSTVLGQVILMNWYYDKRIGIQVMYLFKQTFKGILPFQILGAVAALAAQGIFHSAWTSFIGGGVIYVAVAMSGYVLFGCNQQEKDMIHTMLKRAIKRG